MLLTKTKLNKAVFYWYQLEMKCNFMLKIVNINTHLIKVLINKYL